MKKQLSLFTLSSALLLTACADGDEPIEESDQNQAWNDIQDSGSMTVATAGTLFPTSYHSEENGLTGYEVELVRAVADQIGVEVEFEEIGVETMTQALNSEECI